MVVTKISVFSPAMEKFGAWNEARGGCETHHQAAVPTKRVQPRIRVRAPEFHELSMRTGVGSRRGARRLMTASTPMPMSGHWLSYGRVEERSSAGRCIR